jgi:NAD(P)-dependent dehydrogenase (short-subunit alcohol dehydrogenase family)
VNSGTRNHHPRKPPAEQALCLVRSPLAALHRIAGQSGPVDVLVNSAGIVGPNKPLLKTTAQQWRRVFDVNVLGTVNTMRAFGSDSGARTPARVAG